METIEKTRDRESDLATCEGFAVYGATARIGVVESVRADAGTGRPTLLSVRAGLLGSWLVHVPVAEVQDVRPDEQMIVLRSGALLAGPRRV